MWRTLFMAFGAFIILLGAQCLVVEKFVLKSRPPTVQTNWAGQSQTIAPPRRQMAPTEWAPFSLMAGGSVIWLYAISISSRMKK